MYTYYDSRVRWPIEYSALKIVCKSFFPFTMTGKLTTLANGVDLDQMPLKAASDQGPHYLHFVQEFL